MNDLRPQQTPALEGEDDESGTPVNWIGLQIVDELGANIVTIDICHSPGVYPKPGASSVSVWVNLHRVEVPSYKGNSRPKRIIVGSVDPTSEAVLDFSPTGSILVNPK